MKIRRRVRLLGRFTITGLQDFCRIYKIHLSILKILKSFVELFSGLM